MEPRPRSSTGESSGLLIRRLQVRVLPGAPRRPSGEANTPRRGGLGGIDLQDPARLAVAGGAGSHEATAMLEDGAVLAIVEAAEYRPGRRASAVGAD